MANTLMSRSTPEQGAPRPNQSVRHAVGVLRAFSPAEPVLGVNEISRRVRLDRSTVSRLLRTMEELGLISRVEPGGRYRLGMGLAELAGVALAGLDIRDVAQPHLRRLSAATRETINLAIWDRDRAVIIEHVAGLEPIKALGWVGRHHPGHCTSVGKVFLAFLDRSAREAVLARPLAAYTRQTITDPDRLRAELDEIRRRGFGINRAELQEGLNAVAAPVRDHRGQVAAALGLAGPAYRLTEERLLELSEQVVAAAAAISRDLGAGLAGTSWQARRGQRPGGGTVARVAGAGAERA
jgi:DNA-binding IclR family transcriptional regulator